MKAEQRAAWDRRQGTASGNGNDWRDPEFFPKSGFFEAKNLSTAILTDLRNGIR
jgi:hypothetical protein